MSDRVPDGVNRTPEEFARDRIDDRIRAAGWQVLHRDVLDVNAGIGIAVREIQTDTGPADYARRLAVAAGRIEVRAGSGVTSAAVRAATDRGQHEDAGPAVAA